MVAGASQGGVAYLRGDARRPARAIVQFGVGVPVDLAPETIPADFPAEDLVIPQQIIYNATDGMPVARPTFPAARQRGHHKACRPGLSCTADRARQMLLGWHYMDYYNNFLRDESVPRQPGVRSCSPSTTAAASATDSISARRSITGRAVPVSFNDVEGAGLYLRTRADVDPARIGLWGGSYGGYLTALGLARASSLFAAGVDFHGVHDWSTRIAGNPTSRARRLNRRPWRACGRGVLRCC